MNFSGVIVGFATFLMIGIFHPIVIKMEYYLGKQSWWLLFVAGIVFTISSLLVSHFIISTILGATAFSCFWGILEIFEQECRVLKGWFPENPKRHKYYEAIREKKAQSK